MSIETIIMTVSVAVAGYSIGRMWTQKQMQDLLYELLRDVEKMTKGE